MPSGQSICRKENNFKFILCVSENANNSCTSYKYFISINCLQMYHVKIPLLPVIQLDNITPIILEISPQHDSLHFIPTPCWEMNERFCLATIHQILQDEIEMFAMHPLPLTTQGTCHHLYEVNINAIREISNCHLIPLCVRRWVGADDVNMSIDWWKNLNKWQNNNL